MELFRIRDSLAFKKEGYKLRLVKSAENKVKTYQLNEYTMFVVELLLKEASSINDIVQKVNTHFEVETSYEDVSDLLSTLIDMGIVIQEINNHPLLSRDDIEKFDRQLRFFSEYEQPGSNRFEYQRRLMDSEVTILGLGGIGSNVFLSLLHAGVSKFNIADYDTVELNNLHRQVIYSKKDVGKLKVDVAEDIALSINDKAQINKFQLKMDKETSLGDIVGNSQLVICCMDEPNVDETGKIVAEHCIKEKLNHIVSGGYSYHLGLIGLSTIPFETACIGCLHATYEEITKIKGEFLPSNYMKGGTLTSISITVANLITVEAIKLITGFAPPQLANCQTELNFITNEIKKLEVSRHHECQICGQPVPVVGKGKV